MQEVTNTMGAIILNGDLKGHNGLTTVQKIVENELEKANWNTETFILNKYNIKSFTGCFKC